MPIPFKIMNKYIFKDRSGVILVFRMFSFDWTENHLSSFMENIKIMYILRRLNLKIFVTKIIHVKMFLQQRLMINNVFLIN